MGNKYILITPVKNEEKTIEQVINSVRNQSLKPFLWVIVNDGSTDKTKEILKEKTKNLRWVKVINKVINKRYNWLGYSRVINEGIKYCEKHNLFEKKEIKYLGILDSDITIERYYFQKLVSALNKNSSLGVVCGGIYIKRKGVWEIEYKNNKNPRGGARLYNLDIFREIGFFPNTPSPDRISDIKIQNRGYKIGSLNKIKAFQHRATFEKENKLKGHFNSGKGKYILGYSFIHTFLISIEISYKRRPYLLSGILFFIGFLSGFLSQDKRIQDWEIKEYSRNFWKRILKRK